MLQVLQVLQVLRVIQVLQVLDVIQVLGVLAQDGSSTGPAALYSLCSMGACRGTFFAVAAC